MLQKTLFNFLLLSFFLVGCQKNWDEDPLPENPNNIQVNLLKIQTWYRQITLGQSSNISEQSGNGYEDSPQSTGTHGTSVIFEPQWDLGEYHLLSDGNTLAIFPVHRNLSIRYHDIGFVRRLAVLVDEYDNVISGEILEMIGNKAFLKQHKRDIPRQYYEDTTAHTGAIMRTYNIPQNQISSFNYNNASSDCITIGMHLDANTCELLIFDSCENVQVVQLVSCSIQTTVDDGGGSSGGGTGSTGGGDTGGNGGDGNGGGGSSTPPMDEDCFDTVAFESPTSDFSTVYDNCGGSLIDLGDNTITPEIEITLDQSFKDNPKLMCVWEKLKNNETLKNLLKDFASNPYIDLKLKIGVKPLTDSKYENTFALTFPIGSDNDFSNPDFTDADFTPVSGVGSVGIYLKEDGINTFPPIIIAEAIIHELLHAYIFGYIMKFGGMSAMTPTMGNLYKAYDAHDDNGIWNHGKGQHEFMAEYYAATMAQILADCDGNQANINEYRSLVWDGMRNSDYYDENYIQTGYSEQHRDLLLKLAFSDKGNFNKNCN